MDQSNKKIVSLSFLFSGVLAFYLTVTAIQILQASFGVFARLSESNLFIHGVPFTVGFVTFLYLQFNSKTVLWAHDAVSEIRKMVWTSMKDTVAITIAVCVMSILSGVILGLLDFISSKVINYLISL